MFCGSLALGQSLLRLERSLDPVDPESLLFTVSSTRPGSHVELLLRSAGIDSSSPVAEARIAEGETYPPGIYQFAIADWQKAVVDMGLGEILTVVARSLDPVTQEVSYSNEVAFNEPPWVHVIAVSSRGSVELWTWYPVTDEISRRPLPELTDPQDWVAAQSSDVVFYESQSPRSLLRSTADEGVERIMTLAPGALFDLVSVPGSKRLLVLSREPYDGRNQYRLSVWDDAQRRLQGPLTLLETDRTDSRAWMLPGASQGSAFFAESSTKLRKCSFLESLVAGSWVYPSPDRCREVLVRAEVHDDRLVTASARLDGNAGRISVAELTGTRKITSIGLGSPQDFRIVSSPSGLEILVLEKGGRLVKIGQDRAGGELVFVEAVHVPNATEIVAAPLRRSCFVLSRDGSGSRIVRVDLDHLGQTPTRMAATDGRWSELEIVESPSQIWLLALEVSADSGVIFWKLDASNHGLLGEKRRLQIDGEPVRLVIPR